MGKIRKKEIIKYQINARYDYEPVLFSYSFLVPSPCQDNGGCSQFCVLRPAGRTCLCGAGLKLAEDGISCKSLNLVVYCCAVLALMDLI